MRVGAESLLRPDNRPHGCGHLLGRAGNQGVGRARVAEHAEAVCRLLAHLGIGVLERGDERVDGAGVAQLAKRPDGALPYFGIRVLEGLCQEAHVLGIALPPQGVDCVLTDLRRLVLEHCGNGFRREGCTHPHQR